MDAEHLVVFLLRDHLHHPFGQIEDARLAVGGEREGPDLHLVPPVLGRFLGEPDGGDLGLGVGGARHQIVIHGIRLLPRQPVSDEFAFHERQVRELGMRPPGDGDHVSDGRHPALAGEQGLGIDDHEPALHPDVGELLQTDVLAYRAPAHRAEEQVRLQDLGSLGGRHGRLHQLALDVDGLQLGVGERLDLPLAEHLLELGRDVFVLHGQEAR